LREYHLPADDALLLSKNKAAAVFFEAVLAFYTGVAKNVSNWILGDVTRLLKEEKRGFVDLKFSPADLATLLTFLDQNVISGKIAKTVLTEMFETGTPPAVIIRERGLFQINDPKIIKTLVLETLATNEKAVWAYRSGKEKAAAFLVGAVMKRSNGRVNPELLAEILKLELAKDETKDNTSV
jgi:aspartyl-tRNA(Asn)/glutamyl-tRNA(Gln) amidotransferase subunit B